jgi:hypothetical protein
LLILTLTIDIKLGVKGRCGEFEKNISAKQFEKKKSSWFPE